MANSRKKVVHDPELIGRLAVYAVDDLVQYLVSPGQNWPRGVRSEIGRAMLSQSFCTWAFLLPGYRQAQELLGIRLSQSDVDLVEAAGAELSTRSLWCWAEGLPVSEAALKNTLEAFRSIARSSSDGMANRKLARAVLSVAESLYLRMVGAYELTSAWRRADLSFDKMLTVIDETPMEYRLFPLARSLM